MDVESLLLKRDIPFTERGNDYLVSCLSPDHDDSNPSMRIDKIQGLFNCFSCNFSGNIFDYFGEEGPSGLHKDRERFKDLLYRKQGESLGLQHPKRWSPYRETWRNISPETYEKFEAFTSPEDDFKGRLIFPLKSLSGKIVSFQGRTFTNQTPKYKNWPKKTKLPFYPLFDLVQDSIILVEGIFDAINLYDKGLPNAVCCFGVNNFNIDRLDLLSIRGCRKLYTFFDGDSAGQQGAETVRNLCEKMDFPHKNIHLKGRDPGELSKAEVDKLTRTLYG